MLLRVQFSSMLPAAGRNCPVGEGTLCHLNYLLTFRPPVLGRAGDDPRFSATRISPPSWVWPQITGTNGGVARPRGRSYIRGMCLATKPLF